MVFKSSNFISFYIYIFYTTVLIASCFEYLAMPQFMEEQIQTQLIQLRHVMSLIFVLHVLILKIGSVRKTNGSILLTNLQKIIQRSVITFTIYIFDRYGKLLKQLDPDGAGWNGTYNGAEMPSTDYWFKIIYIENNEQKEFRAHFSLKRQLCDKFGEAKNASEITSVFLLSYLVIIAQH